MNRVDGINEAARSGRLWAGVKEDLDAVAVLVVQRHLVVARCLTQQCLVEHTAYLMPTAIPAKLAHVRTCMHVCMHAKTEIWGAR